MHNIDAERLAILRQIVEHAIRSGWTLSEFQARMEVELHDHQQLSPQVERWLAILHEPLQVLAEQAPNRLAWPVDSNAPAELKARIAELEQGKHSQSQSQSLLERAMQAQRDAPARRAAVEEEAQRRLSQASSQESAEASSAAAEISNDLFFEQIRRNASLCRQILGVDQQQVECAQPRTGCAHQQHLSDSEPRSAPHHPEQPSAQQSLPQRLKCRAAKLFAKQLAFLRALSSR